MRGQITNKARTAEEGREGAAQRASDGGNRLDLVVPPPPIHAMRMALLETFASSSSSHSPSSAPPLLLYTILCGAKARTHRVAHTHNATLSSTFARQSRLDGERERRDADKIAGPYVARRRRGEEEEEEMKEEKGGALAAAATR